MTDKVKAFWLGVFILVGLGIATWLVLFLRPTFGDGGKTLFVRFTNIERISIGTRVTFAGKPVGEVVAIREIFDARNQPSLDPDRLFFYELELRVDSGVHIYNYDEVIFSTSGLMGEKSIAIIPRSAPKGSPPAQEITGDVLYARSTDKLEETLDKMTQVAGKLEVTMEEVNRFVDKNGDDFNLALKSLTRASNEATTFLSGTNCSQFARKAIEAFEAMQFAMNKAEVFLDEVLAKDLVGSIESSLWHFDAITDKILCGEGTLGKLLTSDCLYLQMTATMSHLETVLSDINHYGLLFQYNKGWQRERSARMNRMHQLCTPYDFYQYFNDEMCSISVSLGRVSKLLDTMECQEIVLDNECFGKQFNELLCKVQNLENSLRLFNEVLMKQWCKSCQ